MASITLIADARVSDGGTLSYQWYKDGTAITGATTANYTLTATETAGYTCVVTNTNPNTGRTSSAPKISIWKEK